MKLISAMPLILIGQLALAKMAAPGTNAPDFTLMGHDGKKYQLSEVLKSGNHVVLEWFNNECPYVVKHYDSKNMQSLQAKYTNKGVKWFSIISSAKGKQGYRDPAGATRTKKEQGQASTAVLLDPDGTVGKKYGAKTTPQMVVIKPSGKIVYHGAIDSIPSADKSDISKATNYVTAALDATLAGKAVATATSKPYGCSVKYASKSWF